MSEPLLTLPTGKHYRLIHTKYPPMDLFESDDSYDLGLLESATSDRIHNWRRFVSIDDFRTGSGWSTVMASFCYPGEGGRFNGPDQGAYYAGFSMETAVREWSWHAARLWAGMGLTAEASAMARCYVGKAAEALVDVCGEVRYAGSDYAESRALGRSLLRDGYYGVLYDSVRHTGGHCAAFLRPPGTTPVTQAGHCVLKWDGSRFTEYAKTYRFHSLL